MRWNDWVNQLEMAGKALHEKKSYGNHIGGKVYCTIAENRVCVDTRQYRKPEKQQVGEIHQLDGILIEFISTTGAITTYPSS